LIAVPGLRPGTPRLATISIPVATNRGRVPIQAAAGLDRYIRATGSTVAEAFTALCGKGGPIIFIEEEDSGAR
jgi:hypothetical protein